MVARTPIRRPAIPHVPVQSTSSPFPTCLPINQFSTTATRHVGPRVAVAKAVGEGQHPVDIFCTLEKEGSVTRAIADQCLEAFQEQLAGMNEEDAQAEIKKKAAGQIVLTWLWEQYDDMDHLHDRPLITRMVDFVISEGHEEMVWDWICNNETRKTDVRIPLKFRLEWRKTAACAIAQAKAKDLEGSLDNAIEVAIRVFNLYGTCDIS